MNLKSFVSTTLLAVGFATVAPFGHSAEKKPSPAEAELVAKARATYPLKTCLVSDEPLGSMGEATAYVHRAVGQPDRVVFFCCDGCLDDFKQDPAKYLKKVDAAAKGAKPSGPAKDAPAKKKDH
jgi:hypothetical protein